MKPGETQSFVITLPYMMKKRAVQMETTVTLDNGYSDKILQYETNSFISKVANAPVVDGKIDNDEWKGSWFYADKASDVIEIPDWAGPKDVSFSGDMMWDEENLYVASKVKDDVFHQPFTGINTWQGDGIQLAFSYPGDNVYQEFCLVKSPEGMDVYRHSSAYGKIAGPVKNITMAVEYKNGETIYEIKIPWNEIYGDDFKPEAQKPLTFSMLCNDNEGASRGYVEFCSGIGPSKDPNMYGHITLVD